MSRLICDRDAAVGSACDCHPGRRAVLLGGALFGLGLHPATAQMTAQMTGQSGAVEVAPHRIDVHHHLTPPGYVAKVSPRVPVMAPTAGWTLAKTIEDMQRAQIARAMLSVTTPGLWFGDAGFAAALARECNDYGATLMRDHPTQFGLFAALPLPDIEGSLKEIGYALDTLHAQGIALFTSYAGKYLGDPAFAPVFEELDRRHAVVFTHPTSAQCCSNVVPSIPDPAIEYGTDTTRTIASLVFSGTATRYRNIRFVFSHAGGTMPMLIERFQFIARDPKLAANTGGGLMPLLRSFYYDTAQAANPAAMSALRAVVEVSQILFGTDFPYRRGEENAQGMQNCGFTVDELAAIDRGNAERLLAL